MPFYTFVRDSTPQGFLRQSRLGTDVLNALAAIRAAGHLIDYAPELLEEREREGRETAFLEIAGPHPLDTDVRGILLEHGIRIYSQTEDG